MHNKSFTVDNQVTILGGRNIGNEYFEADPDIAFADLDVLLIGPVIADVSASFDAYWNSELVYPINVLAKKTSHAKKKFKKKTRGSSNEFIKSNRKIPPTSWHYATQTWPMKSGSKTCAITGEMPKQSLIDPRRFLTTGVGRTIIWWRSSNPIGTELQKELIILSPYFVPGKEGVESLVRIKRERC